MDESAEVSGPGSDADLLNAIRSGDAGAYDVLLARHKAAARRLAGLLRREPSAADEIARRAVAQVLDAISRGGGPTDAFRPYLLTAVRRVARVAGAPAGAAEPTPTDAQQLPDPGQRLIDPAVAAAAAAPEVAAFESLPERWRAVLWHTQIELATPAKVAPLLGLTAAEVAELADRALDGLARALPQAQLAATVPRDPAPAGAAPAPSDSAAPSSSPAEAAVGGPTDARVALRDTVAAVVLGAAAADYLPALPAPPAAPVPAWASRATKPALAAGAAGGWLAGKARGATPQQRTIAAGVAALLVVVAVGGYVLSLNPGGADGATGGGTSRSPAAASGPTSAGLTSSAAARRTSSPSATATPSASPTSSAPSATPADPGSGGGSSPAPVTSDPGPTAPATSPTADPTPSQRPTTAPPSSAPPTSPAPVTTPVGHPRPPGPGPGQPSPSPRAQAPDARLTAAVSVLGPVGFSRAAAVAFSVTNAGPGATGDLMATFSLPSGTALGTGDGAVGWSCRAAARSVACGHAPLGAAGRADGILTVMITGPAACGQPVSVTVSGGQSAAGAQSGSIQCGQPQFLGALAGRAPGPIGTASFITPATPAWGTPDQTAAGTAGPARRSLHRARPRHRAAARTRLAGTRLAGTRRRTAGWPAAPGTGSPRPGRWPGFSWPAGGWPRPSWPGTWGQGHGPTWPGAPWPSARPPGY
jgi:DNA-directed RNA polymerase specialized sigma24 family protein